MSAAPVVSHDWARFNDRLKAELLARIDCFDVLEAYGVESRERGGRRLIRCPHPNHADNNPSCYVWPRGARAVFVRCYSCEFKGDLFDLVGALEGGAGWVDQLKAAARVAGLDYDSYRAAWVAEERKAMGLAVTRETPTIPSPPPRARPQHTLKATPPELDEERRETIAKVNGAIVERLGLDDEGAAWLEGRGLVDVELARGLRLRSCTGKAWRETLRAVAEEQGEEALEIAGWWKKGKPWPGRLRGPFVILPYLNRGVVSWVRLRNLDTSPDINAKLLNPHGAGLPHVPFLEVCAEEAKAKGAPLYVVEGELDALALVQLHRYAIGIPGAQGWRSSWVRYFEGVERVIVLCEGDESGNGLAETIWDACAEELGAAWCLEHLSGATPDQDNPRLDACDALLRGRLAATLDAIETKLYGRPFGWNENAPHPQRRAELHKAYLEERRRWCNMPVSCPTFEAWLSGETPKPIATPKLEALRREAAHDAQAWLDQLDADPRRAYTHPIYPAWSKATATTRAHWMRTGEGSKPSFTAFLMEAASTQENEHGCSTRPLPPQA